MNDNEIIDLYWERNESAISETSDKYGSYCHSISYNILHNDSDAEECVSDTWLKAWNSIPPNRPDCLSGYLGKITRNLSINRFRQYTAQKRNFGQYMLVLSELEECIPSETGMEKIVEEMALTMSRLSEPSTLKICRKCIKREISKNTPRQSQNICTGVAARLAARRNKTEPEVCISTCRLRFIEFNNSLRVPQSSFADDYR